MDTAEDLPLPNRECEKLVKIMGIHAAFCLIETYGGSRLYVPATDLEKSKLAAVIGLGPLKSLSEVYGREQIAIPLGKPWRIIVYRSRGMKYSDIARAVSCTERSVNRVLADYGMIGLKAKKSSQ